MFLILSTVSHTRTHVVQTLMPRPSLCDRSPSSRRFRAVPTRASIRSATTTLPLPPTLPTRLATRRATHPLHLDVIGRLIKPALAAGGRVAVQFEVAGGAL